MTMILAGAAAALLAAAAPAAATIAAPSNKPKTEQPAKAKSGEKSKADDFDPAQLFAIFDKMFPPQPDPAPARLALSRVSVQSLFPDGTYTRLVEEMVSGFAERILDMSEADFGKKGKSSKLPSTMTLREELMKEDPHFEERMRITRKVLVEELAKLGPIIELKMREGLARSMARRFDEKQLADINAFLATESGRSFGRQSMAMWFDSDMMRSMMSTFPDMIIAMPAAMKRLETETAHLPKPPKSKKEKAE